MGPLVRSTSMLGRLVVVAVLAGAPIAFAVTPASVNVTGSYHSNYDDVKLVQDGDRVHGTYVCCGGGTIEGRIIEGRTVRYVWRQPSAQGMGVWTIEPGHLDGTWGNGQSAADGGRWDLKRILPNSQIAQ
jgi:hypothetical protein